MRTLVEDIKHMITKAEENDTFVATQSEPILGYAAETKEEENNLFWAIVRRIEEEYTPKPRFDDGRIVKIGDMADLDGSIKPVKDIRVGVFFDGKGLVFTPTIKRYYRDSVERITEDARKPVGEYWGCSHLLCKDCPCKINGEEPYKRYGVRGCIDAQKLDLVHRMQEVLKQE